MGKIYRMPFNWDYVDDNTLIYVDTSADGIKAMVDTALGEALDDVKADVVDETISTMDIKLEGENLLYRLLVKGDDKGEINIPKDQFLKSASYDKDNKKLIFVMETTDGEKTTEVSISELIEAIEEKNSEQDASLGTKADKTEVDSALQTINTKNTEQDAAIEEKAVKADVESALALKADKSELEPLAKSADVAAEIAAAVEPLATKEEVNAIDLTPFAKTEDVNAAVEALNAKDAAQDAEIALKAVKADVDAALELKADKTELESLATKEEVANVDAKFADYATADALNAEVARATAKENEVTEALNVEIQRATAAESELTGKVVAEQARAEAKEAELVEKDAELAAKDEAQDAEIAKKVDWTESDGGRKHITLKNHDSVLGTATDGGTYNLAMVSKWDVADFGSAQLHANLNSKDGSVTINDDKVIATEDYVTAAIATKANAEDVYTKTQSDEKFQASGDYVPVEKYNELKARLDNLEIMLSVYNEEREAQMDEIISNMSSDNKEVVVDTLMESIVVPETTVAYTITAPLTDNSTVELTSPKYMTLINTSKEPVSTTISHTYAEGETTSATSVYLVGNFDTLTLENVSPLVKSRYDAASVNNVVISENNVKNLKLNLDFQDGATITNNSDKDITITDKSNSEIALTIVAPNSTVTLSGGQFTTLNAEVSDNTLIINKSVHIDNLNLTKGNAIVEVARAEEIAGIVENYTVADGYTLSHRIYHITNENSSKLGGVGEMILDENITRTSSIVAPVAPAYNAVWNLNGHNITVEGTPKSGVYLNQYVSNLEVKGEGVIHCEGSYGLWNSTTTGKIIINDGVTIEAQTHAVYAEKGVIEINGGTFKLTNWANADKDENGNLKFLINCYDASYTNGSANIIVKGGKFYDFNPAASYGEPNGPVSYVAEGYESVMTTEMIDGVEHKVFEVKPINE